MGFEPTALKIKAAVFKTASLNRSDTPPRAYHIQRMWRASIAERNPGRYYWTD